MEDTVSSNEPQERYPPSLNSIKTIFEEFNVPEVSDEICTRVLDVIYRHTFDILEESKAISVHAGHKSIEASDAKLAIESISEGLMFAPPHREQLMTYADQRNSQPLPAIRPHCGIRLPNERYSLTAPNYVLASGKELQDSLEKVNEDTLITAQVPNPQGSQSQLQSLQSGVLRLSTPLATSTRPPTVGLPIGSSTVHLLAPPGIGASMIRIQSVQGRDTSAQRRSLPVAQIGSANNLTQVQRRFVNGQQ